MLVSRSYIIAFLLVAVANGCASTRQALGLANNDEGPAKPIQNPFGPYYSPAGAGQPNVVLRTKKGDRSVEIELPASNRDLSDFVIPVNPAFKDGRSPASDGSVDDTYKDRGPTLADREITSKFPQPRVEDEGKRREIEQGMGLVPSENAAPEADKSYLAAVDHVRQLYKQNRYEAALIETDDLLKVYQTDPRLFQMRGTLLDRLGQHDLAMKSWNQALHLDPSNKVLRKFIDRRQKPRAEQ